MSQQQFVRFLSTIPQVQDFLSRVLEVNLDDYPKIEYDIVKCEKGTLDGLTNPTYTKEDFRDRKYNTDEKRLALQKLIVEELFSLKILDKDDDICLGSGGASPNEPKKEKQAFILIGLPASGKSSIATKIAQEYGAYILDSDFAKRKLPEYSNYDWGASIVHQESSMIVFGNKEVTGFDSLYSKVLSKREGHNIIIPTIGANPDDVISRCEELKKLGYNTHLTLVYLPKEKATVRALMRFHKHKRYVPLSLIFDVYGNNPALTYFMLKNRKKDCIDSYGIINTDVPMGNDYFCTDLDGENPANLFVKEKNVLI